MFLGFPVGTWLKGEGGGEGAGDGYFTSTTSITHDVFTLKYDLSLKKTPKVNINLN